MSVIERLNNQHMEFAREYGQAPTEITLPAQLYYLVYVERFETGRRLFFPPLFGSPILLNLASGTLLVRTAE